MLHYIWSGQSRLLQENIRARAMIGNRIYERYDATEPLDSYTFSRNSPFLQDHPWPVFPRSTLLAQQQPVVLVFDMPSYSIHRLATAPLHWNDLFLGIDRRPAMLSLKPLYFEIL
jgi:hypothetical protein